MDKMDYPRGLVRYTTENALEGRPSRVIRPRTIIYTVLLLALVTAGATGLAMREPVRLDILTDRNTLYRETGDGLIENSYSFKLTNMSGEPHTYGFSVEGPAGVRIETQPREVRLAAGETRTIPARIQLDPDVTDKIGGVDVTVTVESLDGTDITGSETTRFRTPVGR
jgi:polyferredoxin